MKNKAINSGSEINEGGNADEEQICSMAVDFEELSSSPERYIQTLVDSLGSPDERVRKYAFEVMCELADERAVKILTLYLSHKDNLVRYSVKKALEAVKKKCPGRFDAIINCAPPAAGAGKKISGVSGFLFFAVAAVIIIPLLYNAKFEKDMPAVSGPGGAVKQIKTAGAGGTNVIKYDEKGAPVITVKGLVSSYNSIKREAVIDLNSYGDSCKVIFDDSMKIDFTKGSKLEVEAEILHNDNINPLLLKAKSYRRPAAGY
jgi:hypothetical protein